jgi:predicted nucleic acid-binding protein
VAQVVDTSIWVDALRPKSPVLLIQQTDVYTKGKESVICEPILFELLAPAPQKERDRVENILATVPVLNTPADLWLKARRLGQRCIDHGVIVSPFDLLIAQTCLHHQAMLITFDAHYLKIAKVEPKLKLTLLKRAAGG